MEKYFDLEQARNIKQLKQKMFNDYKDDIKNNKDWHIKVLNDETVKLFLFNSKTKYIRRKGFDDQQVKW